MRKVETLSTYPNLSFYDNNGFYYASSDFEEIRSLGVKMSEPLRQGMQLSMHGRKVVVTEVQIRLQQVVGDYEKGWEYNVYGRKIPYPLQIIVYTEDAND